MSKNQLANNSPKTSYDAIQRSFNGSFNSMIDAFESSKPSEVSDYLPEVTLTFREPTLDKAKILAAFVSSSVIAVEAS